MVPSPETTRLSVPTITKTLLRNVFRKYVDKGERIDLTVPTVTRIYKKSIRVVIKGDVEEYHVAVPEATRAFKKSYLQYLVTYGPDEVITPTVPEVVKVFSTCKPLVDPFSLVDLEWEKDTVTIRWVNESKTYNSISILRRKILSEEEDTFKEVGNIPYGSDPVYLDIDNFTEGEAYEYQLVLNYGPDKILSDVFMVNIKRQPTENILLKFVNKISQVLPLNLRFKE